MSIGKMTSKIKIYNALYEEDGDGFAERELELFKEIHAYKDVKSSTKKWSNNTMLEDADCVFTIRFTKGIENTQIIESDGRFYSIMSVENIRGKNMYLEIVTKLEVVEDGKY